MRRPARVFAVLVLVTTSMLASARWAQAASPCPAGSRCGSVSVPLDRQNPAAGTIDIHYALVPRTDPGHPAVGTIVPNIGGPGMATIANARFYLQPLAPLRRNRDLLLIDARGAGQSGAITCPSIATHDPLSLDSTTIAGICGADLGPRSGLYGSAAIADDIDAVRAALGLDKLDLWGDSYGTFLMPVYAARYPEHVRSLVLDGAFPLAFDPWGRDILQGVRRVVGLVCRRTHRCSGQHVLSGLARLAQRLRHHPVHYTAHSPIGPVRLTLGEHELANVTFGLGHPEVYGLLPAAVDAALHHDFALLRRLVTIFRIGEASDFLGDPALDSPGAYAAGACHDYPRPYDLAAAPAVRRAQYERGLAALGPAPFRPFSARAWLSIDIDAGPKCLDWPADPSAGSPLQGHAIPDVPVLVQSGELDTNTPIEQGRRAAAQFHHPIYGIVANAGHTPDLQPCGVAMAIDFVEHLNTNRNRCRHTGRPPTVIGRPPLHAAQLSLPPVRAVLPARRALAVALATLADERAVSGYSGMTGVIDALRGGTYLVAPHRIRFVAARAVIDAAAYGALVIGRHSTTAQLRLLGRGVERSRLTIHTAGRTTRITGVVGRRHVNVRLTMSPVASDLTRRRL